MPFLYLERRKELYGRKSNNDNGKVRVIGRRQKPPALRTRKRTIG